MKEVGPMRHLETALLEQCKQAKVLRLGIALGTIAMMGID